MSSGSYTVVDVFTETPLQGNALAVFTDAAGLTGELMQRIARELNLSETAFILPGRDGADAAVRIFTPAEELPFAGHPVLGSAFVLATRSKSTKVTLATGAGPVPVALRWRDGAVTYGEMNQPIPTREDPPRAEALLGALGLEGSELPIEAYRNGPVHVYVALKDEPAVAALRPDGAALADLGARFGISCFAAHGARVKTRMFAPGLGVPEDPATGSAAGPLALHLARHGRIAYGQEIEIRQGEEVRRPSRLYARVEGFDGGIDRVVVGGAAVIVAEGSYRLP
jgi:trans-2,3-dihydro-3-hydroxyanthranilate isomerase